MATKIVHLDAGHGGKDPGACANGLQEKDITLAITLKIGKILERHGVKVCYSRTTDKYLSLTERAELSNKNNADAFVSIHTNSFTSPSARGLEVWTSRGQTKGDILATYVGEELIKAFPNVPFRKDMSDGDLDKESNFTVLVKTKAPACLCELGFISNKEDNKLQTGKQDEFAVAIAKGILRFLGIAYKEEVKKTTSTNTNSSGAVGYRVQVGYFTVKKNAENLVKELKAKGYDAFIVEVKK